LFGASSNGEPSILIVPLLPGGFGAAGALDSPPATTGMMKPAVATSRPVPTSTRPRVDITSEFFATVAFPPSGHQRHACAPLFSTLGLTPALQVGEEFVEPA
jgi:hypothetical protein